MMHNAKFELGQVVMTRCIADMIADNEQFAKDVTKAFKRYCNADFSDMKHEEDVQLNIDAIEKGDDRIMATYKTCEGDIWIITEWDRSATTILFPSEY